MSNRLIQSPGPNPIDWLVYNTDTTRLVRGTAVKWAAAEDLKLTANVMYTGERGPLEGTEDSTIFPVTITTAASDRIVGIVQGTIEPGEFGYVRVFGYGVAKITETASDNTLTAYGASSTNGQMREVTPAGTDAFACQIGTSGTTSAGDLRSVFIDCIPIVRSQAADGLSGTGRIFSNWL